MEDYLHKHLEKIYNQTIKPLDDIEKLKRKPREIKPIFNKPTNPNDS